MIKIEETIENLQKTLNQQYSIFKIHQDLHFDWLQSVKFQLTMYDESQCDINMHKSEPNTDADEITHNQNIQQKNILDSYKKQIDDDYSNPSPLVPRSPLPPLPPKKMSKLPLTPHRPKEIQTQPNLPLNFSRSYTSPSLNLNTSPSIKFVDNDSLLSTSASSFNSDSGFDGGNDDNETNISLSQTINKPYTMSGFFRELSLSASSFNQHWHEMVEEKKRQTLTPKAHGALFEFDRVPDSYQITDSDDEDQFSFSSDDEEIHDEDPFEIHGKMIPMWARLNNVNKQLKKQQRCNPDEIFEGMPKHCFISQIFGVDKRPSLSTEDTWDEPEECDELILA